MRVFPRKSRHQWVFFLLMVCMLGVYLAYRRLVESENTSKVRADHTPHKQNFEEMQKQLKEKVKSELKSGRIKVNEVDSRLGDGDMFQDVVNYEVKADVAGVGRVLDNEEDYVSTEERLTRLKLLLLQLSPTDWKSAPDPDEIIMLVKSELIDLNIDSKMSCQEIDRLKPNHRNQGFHGTKYIDYMKQDLKHEFVVKSVGNDHQLKIECMKADYNAERCRLMANYKLVKELILLIILDNPTLIKLHGFCLRGDSIDLRIAKRGVLLVTEAGRLAQQELLSMLTWKARLEMAIKVVEMLMYMEKSPIGSLGFDRLHLADFLLVNGNVKFVDFDNINIGEPACKHDLDCVIKERPSKQISCVNKVCKGLNAQRNLLLTKVAYLTNLLRYNRGSVNKEVEVFLGMIEEMKVTQSEVLAWLQKQLKKEDTRQNVDVVDNDLVIKQPAGDRDNRQPDVRDKLKDDRRVKDDKVDREENRVHKVPEKEDTVLKFDKQVPAAGSEEGEYQKFINANFPAMMTVVKKNGFDDNADANYGATVYHKHRRRNHIRDEPLDEPVNDGFGAGNHGNKQDAAVLPREGKGDNKVEETGVTKAIIEAPADKATCLKRALNYTESARARREKRLLTHLGLRELTEKQWMMYAQTIRISKSLGASPITSEKVKGGRMKFEFSENTYHMSKGEYILEYGPGYYHIGYLATHFLDRILGLYHVPPVVARSLSKLEHNNISGSKKTVERLVNASSTEGSYLQGIVSVYIPPVMKTEKLTLSRLETIVDTVPVFSRNQKVQIEYILLWALTKMMQPRHGFLGYKGHLVHFEADQAFTSLHKSLTGYFYNCQFPNTVFKTLNCYRCADSKKMTKICGLGNEVIQKIRNSGYLENEVVIGSLQSADIAAVIDNSATAILQVVDHCVKTFSREQVIY